jgi:hypothetical protein
MAIVYAETNELAEVGDIIFGDVPNMAPFKMECGTPIYSPNFCFIACEDDDLSNTYKLTPIEVNEEVITPLNEYIGSFTNGDVINTISMPDTQNIAFFSGNEKERVEDILTLAKVAYTDSQFKYFVSEFLVGLHHIGQRFDTVEWVKPLPIGNEDSTAEMLWGYLISLLTSNKILAIETNGFTGYTLNELKQKVYARTVTFSVDNDDTSTVTFNFEWLVSNTDTTIKGATVHLDGKQDLLLIPGPEWDDPIRSSITVFRSMLGEFLSLDAATQALRFDLIDLRKPEYKNLLPFINMLKDRPK